MEELRGFCDEFERLELRHKARVKGVVEDVKQLAQCRVIFTRNSEDRVFFHFILEMLETFNNQRKFRIVFYDLVFEGLAGTEVLEFLRVQTLLEASGMGDHRSSKISLETRNPNYIVLSVNEVGFSSPNPTKLTSKIFVKVQDDQTTKSAREYFGPKPKQKLGSYSLDYYDIKREKFVEF